MSWDLEKAHKASSDNCAVLPESTTCTCFYCKRSFAPPEINKWIDRKKGKTAICPHCCVDSVLGSSSGLPIDDPPFLESMHQRWFGRSITPTRAKMERHLEERRKEIQDDD